MSSLNAVVNSLVRAAAAIPNEISDEDLDRHVAKLLADEAKAKEKTWNELGLGAYLGRSEPDAPDPNAPKPNKRFLAAVIRNVDGHNAAVLRAQAQGVRDARDERRGMSGSPRRGDLGDDRSRRTERPAGGASRLFGGALSGLGQSVRAREKGHGDERDERRRKLDRNDVRRSERPRESDRERDADVRDHRRRENRDTRRDYADERHERRSERNLESRIPTGTPTRSPRSSERLADDVPRAGPSRLRGWSDEEDTKETENDKDRRSRFKADDEGRDRHSMSEGSKDKSSRSQRTPDRSRSRERDGNRERHRNRHRDRDESRDRSKRKRRDDNDAPRRSHHDKSPPRRSSRRASSSPDRRSERNDRDSKYEIALEDKKSRRGGDGERENGTRYHDRDDPSRIPKSPIRRRRPSPSPSPPPPPPPPEEPPPPEPDFSPPRPQKLSKMDRYFQSNYDPRLDVGDVPKDGPVLAVGWDNMLAVMKERGSKRRKHSPDLFDEDDRAHRSGKTARGGSPDDLDTRNFEDFERKRKKEKKKKLGLLDEEDEEERKRRKERKKREAEAEAMGLDAKGVMGIKYMPRGGMREWDMGKET